MFPPTGPIHLSLGLIVWSIWFVAVYGGLSVGCAVWPPDPGAGSLTWINAVLGILTALTLAWLILQALNCWRVARTAENGARRPRFIASVGAAIHATAAVATALVGFPIAALPPCL